MSVVHMIKDWNKGSNFFHWSASCGYRKRFEVYQRFFSNLQSQVTCKRCLKSLAKETK